MPNFHPARRQLHNTANLKRNAITFAMPLCKFFLLIMQQIIWHNNLSVLQYSDIFSTLNIQSEDRGIKPSESLPTLITFRSCT